MALENIPVDPGTGGSTRPVVVDTVADGDIQVVKIALGADGAMDTLVDSGQQTMANSLPVVIASDQTAVPVKGGGTAGAADAGVVTIQGIASMTAVQTDTRRLNGSAIDLGNGAVGAGTQRVTLASNSTGQVALAAGSNVVGNVGIDQTTPGTTNAVQPIPGTTGGLSMSKTISAASTNATNVKGSAGQLYHVLASNTAAAARWLKLYNKATAPTVGTDTPVLTLLLPAGGGVVLDIDPMGAAFSTGIAFALTTGVADGDTGAVGANEIVVNLLYK